MKEGCHCGPGFPRFSWGLSGPLYSISITAGHRGPDVLHIKVWITQLRPHLPIQGDLRTQDREHNFPVSPTFSTGTERVRDLVPGEGESSAQVELGVP